MEFRTGRDGKRHPAKKQALQSIEVVPDKQEVPVTVPPSVAAAIRAEVTVEASPAPLEAPLPAAGVHPSESQPDLFEFADGSKPAPNGWIDGVLSKALVRNNLASYGRALADRGYSHEGLARAQHLLVGLCSGLNAVLGLSPAPEEVEDMKTILLEAHALLAGLFPPPVELSSVAVNPMTQCLLPEEPGVPGDPQDLP